MEKALLIHVGQEDFSYTLASKRDYAFKREVQIGFAYLAAVLAQHRIDVEILDLTLNNCTFDQLMAKVNEEHPVFIGFYAATTIKERVVDFVRFLIKNWSDKKILIGGPDIFNVDDYLTAGADAFCIGEGEMTIVELLEYCRGQRELDSIKGVAYYRDGQIFYTTPRELIEDLNELPVPAWDKYDLNCYYDFHVFDMKTPYTSIMASRGCPFNCTYCVSHKIWGNKLRYRSPEHVMNEIDYLVKEKGVRYITFQDDIWGWNNDEWARSICLSLIDRTYDLKWRCILHPFSFKGSRKDILPLMRQAGCTSITTGLQSASARILKNINRSPKEPESLADLIGIAKRLGINNNTAFIFGLPGDTEESIEESIDYALRVRPTFAAFYTLSVLPGSAIWSMEQQGRFTKLPSEFLERKCREAARRFYTNPRIIWQLFYSVLRTNPKWFLKALNRMSYLTQFAGLSRQM